MSVLSDQLVQPAYSQGLYVNRRAIYKEDQTSDRPRTKRSRGPSRAEGFGKPVCETWAHLSARFREKVTPDST